MKILAIEKEAAGTTSEDFELYLKQKLKNYRNYSNRISFERFIFGRIAPVRC